MSFFHQFRNVGFKTFTQLYVLFHNALSFFAITPYFICLTGIQVSATPGFNFFQRLNVVWISVSMQTHNGSKDCKFKPTFKQLHKLFVFGVTVHKSTYIGCPPWNTRKTHIYSLNNRILQTFECTLHISVPQNSAILLVSNPCTSFQINNVFFAHLFHSIVKSLSITLWIHVAYGKCRSCIVTVMVIIIHIIIRFSIVKPEHVYAVFNITFLTHIPNKVACLWICCIESNTVTHPCVCLNRTSFCTN